MKKIRLTEKDLHRIVKRVLNEGLFNRKKKIKSFQDYNDYINGIDTTVTVYQKGDKFLVTRRGHEEYVIKTFDNVEDALRFASDMTNEEKFRTEPEHFTYEDLPYDDSDVYKLNEQEEDNTNRRFEISLCIEEYTVDEDGYEELGSEHRECEFLEESSDPDYINDLYDSYIKSLREHNYTGIFK